MKGIDVKNKITAALFAVFLMTFLLAVFAPTIDAVEQTKKQAQIEAIAEAEQAAEEIYGSMTDEQRMEGVVYE